MEEQLEEPAPKPRLLPRPQRNSYRISQAGLAERTLDRFGSQVVYVPERRTWFAWKNDRWIEDPDTIRLNVISTGRSLDIEASESDDDEVRKALRSLANRAENAAFIEGTVSVAASKSSEFKCRRSAALFDTDAWSLNCSNGTINLRTGVLRPHSPKDYCTRSTETDYSDLPPNPLWQTFLEKVLPDPDVRSFVQIAVGASLTGKPIEERFLFMHGPAATGKSTFLSALRGALGGYYQTANFETFLKSSGSGPRQDLAILQGARIVIASEADDDRRFASGLLKSITGGEQVTARYLYGREFSFIPSFTLWLASNARPAISSEDSGLWRRIVEIPFNVAIPESQRNPQLKQSLVETRHCRETILKWAVEGCLRWQKEGFKLPSKVRDAVADYHASCDDLGNFLSECCTRTSGSLTLMKVVFENYERWCAKEGIKPLYTSRKFRAALGARGWVSKDVAAGVAVVDLAMVMVINGDIS